VRNDAFAATATWTWRRDFGESMTKRILLAVACALAAAISVQAQSNYALVRGSIFDPQHRPIPGAQVHIVAQETGARRDVVSNDAGLYEIAGLSPGAYTVAVDRNGFKQAVQSLTLEVGQQAMLDLQLQIGASSESVTVEASGELLKTQDASIGEVVDRHAVDSYRSTGVC
jgi:hypothetical protein